MKLTTFFIKTGCSAIGGKRDNALMYAAPCYAPIRERMIKFAHFRETTIMDRDFLELAVPAELQPDWRSHPAACGQPDAGKHWQARRNGLPLQTNHAAVRCNAIKDQLVVAVPPMGSPVPCNGERRSALKLGRVADAQSVAAKLVEDLAPRRNAILHSI